MNLRSSAQKTWQRRTWIPYFVLSVTLFLTILAAHSVEQTAIARESVRFESAVQRTHSDIQNRLETYTALLRAGSGLYAANGGVVTRDAFRNYVAQIDLKTYYPGAQGIGFSRRILPDEVDEIVNQVRQQGDPTFNIHPLYSRSEYHAILFLEPLDRRNRVAIGYDMSTEPTRRAAMERARDTGSLAASGRVTLIQEIDPEKQSGFLIYFPVYRQGRIPETVSQRREQLLGFVYSPFRTDDLFQGILSRSFYHYIDFEIYDSPELTPDHLLYHSSPNPVSSGQTRRSRFTTTQTLDIAGRTWAVVYLSRPEISRGAGHSFVPYVLLSGLLTSGVLFGLTRSQSRARAAAEHALASLRQNEAQFRRIIETSQEGIWTIDTNGIINFANPYLAEMLGYELDDIIGHSMFEFMDDVAQAEAAQNLEQSRQGMKELRDLRLRRRDGTDLWTLMSTNPIVDERGRFVGVLAMMTNITERKKTEEALKASESRFRKLTERVRIIPWEADAATENFTYVGPQSVEITGYPLEDWYTDHFWHTHIHPDDRAQTIQACADFVKTRDNYELEYRMLTATGQTIWLYDLVSVVRDETGTPKLLRGIIVDISDRKQVEAERLQLLDREQAARAEAETANRIKDEFLATLSHELRTPLNAMLGWTQLLHTRKFDPETTDRALETINRNTRLLAQLIEDLLDVSRIMTGKFRVEMRPVKLASVIQDAISAVRSQAEDKGVELQSTLDYDLELTSGDYTRLQQMVWNLLTNAIKFTPSGGSVTVRLERGREPTLPPYAPTAQITVSDTGQGISTDFLPFIFERFRQADGTITRSHGGLGLGLAIVRHIVELHGGRIRAESQGKGEGATFIVTLPLGLPPEGTMALLPLNLASMPVSAPAFKSDGVPLNRDRPSLENRWILVVEDEADARDMVMMILHDSGARVTAVASASAAFDVITDSAQPEPPDVIICDIGMPGEDGYSLIRRVRALAGEPGQIPAIALTAYARADDRDKAIAAGFQLHLTKPLDPDKLISAVLMLIRS